MKFRFKVLKNWFHELQYKKFFFWKYYNEDELLSYYVRKNDYFSRWQSEDYYRKYLKKIWEWYEDRIKGIKKDEEWLKIDYYIE